MKGIINHDSEGVPSGWFSAPKRANRLWGTEYIFLHEKTFFENGKTVNYDKIIEAMIKVYFLKRGAAAARNGGARLSSESP
ncbi:MAG: hypothetical protein LBC88_04355 [Spirochaetaceae bacterium]|nr:hypothetical protein [Spirochaetaceae bacterium]